ncbi:MAG: hypothetical protein ACE5JX_06030 [Acidobacteriota bacterium]
MFETRPKRDSTLWKVLPLGALLFGALVLFFVYLGRSQQTSHEPLTGILREPSPDYRWYSKYVTLEKGGIKMGKNFAGKRMVMFAGVVDNGGEKSLDVVEVKLTLFNHDEPVWSAVRVPIRPGPYTRPIPPLQKRGFTLYLEDIPGTWRATNAEMEISGFRFQKRAP